MLEKDRIIVLHTIKHSDSGMVVQCYSATRGRTACYFFAKSKNSRNSQMFPLSVLDVVLHFRTQNGGAMPMIKEASPTVPLNNLKTDIRKGAISIFMCELLLKTLREGDADSRLMEFLSSSAMVLDAMDEGVENFHLHFAVSLCNRLGYMPADNYSDICRHFDFTKGSFCVNYNEAFCFSPEESLLLHRILSTPLSQLPEIKCNGEMRNRFLGKIIDYISFHTSFKTELKSLAVLRELFG